MVSVPTGPAPRRGPFGPGPGGAGAITAGSAPTSTASTGVSDDPGHSSDSRGLVVRLAAVAIPRAHDHHPPGWRARGSCPARRSAFSGTPTPDRCRRDEECDHRCRHQRRDRRAAAVRPPEFDRRSSAPRSMDSSGGPGPSPTGVVVALSPRLPSTASSSASVGSSPTASGASGNRRRCSRATGSVVDRDAGDPSAAASGSDRRQGTAGGSRCRRRGGHRWWRVRDARGGVVLGGALGTDGAALRWSHSFAGNADGAPGNRAGRLRPWWRRAGARLVHREGPALDGALGRCPVACSPVAVAPLPASGREPVRPECARRRRVHARVVAGPAGDLAHEPGEPDRRLVVDARLSQGFESRADCAGCTADVHAAAELLEVDDDGHP